MQNIQINQLCFAQWSDKYYYPAVVSAVLHDHVKVVFLDGHCGIAPVEHVVGLEEAFKTMEMQGKWQNGWLFYKGALASPQTMVMHYDDGDIEQVELRQLRGVRMHCIDLRQQKSDRYN
ncbi:MAG: hypothetical protein FWC93_01510 [Defluviitaleaceae bacterium]|nr:hypothetical protein [Defluviitaleaceae bacterium]